MIPCRDYEPLFIESFYNEISTENQKRLEEHLKECQKCAAEFSNMKATLNVMDRHVKKEPPEEFWANFLPNLEKRLEKEESRKLEPKIISWRQNFTTKYAWAVRLAAAIAFVSIGIFIGKYFKNEPSEQAAIMKTEPSQIAVPANASADERAMRYLKRSQVLLLGLVNFEPESTDSYVPDLSRKKEISEELIQEASVLKRDLNAPSQRRLKELVSDLEVILVQIANLEEQNDLPQIELVKSGVDRKGILLKINLEEMLRNDSALSTETKSASGKPAI
jgi:hypothetical protein